MTDLEYRTRDYELGVLYRTLLAAEHAAEMAGWLGLAKMLKRKRRRVFVAQVLLVSDEQRHKAIGKET